MISKKQKFARSLEGPRGYAKHLRKLHAREAEIEEEIRALIIESYKLGNIKTETDLYKRALSPYQFNIDYDSTEFCKGSPFGIHSYLRAHPFTCRWCSGCFDHL